MSVLRWSVRIGPAMGEPFLGNLKAHLQELIRQHQSVASSADCGPPQKRLKRAVQPRRLRKRERESVAPAPPLHTKKARIERLQAARGGRFGALFQPRSRFVSGSNLLALRAYLQVVRLVQGAGSFLTLAASFRVPSPISGPHEGPQAHAWT